MKKILLILLAAAVLAGCAPKQQAEPRQKKVVERVEVETISVEAESGKLLGGASVAKSNDGYSGDGYVTGFRNESDGVELTVSIPAGSHYDLAFYIDSNGSYKENKILIDGEKAADVSTESDEFAECLVKMIWIDEGEHRISLTKGWGWVDFDRLEIRQSELFGEDIYDLPTELCNPNATKATKSLYRYLMSIYGSYTLSGQHSTEGMASEEFDTIKQKTGKTPALIEIDLLKTTTPFSEEYKNFGPYIDRVTTFDKKGGIVVLNWHWYAPEKYILNSSDQPWWKGFYTEATNINLEKIMSGEDKEGLALLDEDIDIIAEALKTLQKKKIPVLFRPLHEASGGWFWWGACGAEPYKQLYIHLYDRLTNYHKINNLIWVWNGESAEWYPGDDYVDIASTDIYADKGEYTTQINKFIAVGEASNGKKPVALAENGVQIDPDMMERDNVYWLYFCTWGGEYCTTEMYTSDEMFEKVFNSEQVLTLDELPNWRKY